MYLRKNHKVRILFACTLTMVEHSSLLLPRLPFMIDIWDPWDTLIHDWKLTPFIESSFNYLPITQCLSPDLVMQKKRMNSGKEILRAKLSRKEKSLTFIWWNLGTSIVLLEELLLLHHHQDDLVDTFIFCERNSGHGRRRTYCWVQLKQILACFALLHLVSLHILQPALLGIRLNIKDWFSH